MIRTIPSESAVFGATDQEKSILICQNGDITDFLVIVPDFTTAASLTLTVKDPAGDEWYMSSPIAKKQTARIIPEQKIPIDNNYRIYVTLNDVAGWTGGTVTVKTAIEARSKG